MMGLMSEPRQIQIKLTADAFELINRECVRTGMTKLEMISRVVGWFARQDEIVRAAVVGTIPASIAPDVARLALQKMAASEEHKKEKKSA